VRLRERRESAFVRVTRTEEREISLLSGVLVNPFVGFSVDGLLRGVPACRLHVVVQVVFGLVVQRDVALLSAFFLEMEELFLRGGAFSKGPLQKNRYLRGNRASIGVGLRFELFVEGVWQILDG
jgi:hypothetical protein